MIHLSNVTLIGVDCINIDRLILAADISQREMSFGAVKLLTSLPSDDSRVLSIASLDTIDAYSEFCLTKLHEYVDTPYALIIQHDGFILNPQAWDDAFFEYDYNGAPFLLGEWTKERHGIPDSLKGTLLVGNGGFSLRSKKLMELTANLIERGEIQLGDPEDWLMAYTYRDLLESLGIKFAPVALAEAFSFEGRSRDYCSYKDSFGFHGLRWTDISSWLDTHPEYKDKIKNTIAPDAFGE